MSTLWVVRAGSVIVSLVWVIAGWLVGLDHGISDVAPSPEVPTLIVIYVPVAGASLLINGTFRYRRDRVIATRRALAGALACLVVWLVALVVVVLS